MKRIDKQPSTIMPYFKAKETASMLNRDNEDNWLYKVVALPNMTAIIEVWEKANDNTSYLIGTF